MENIPGMLGWTGILGGQARSAPRAVPERFQRFQEDVQLVENKLQVFGAQSTENHTLAFHVIQT